MATTTVEVDDTTGAVTVKDQNGNVIPPGGGKQGQATPPGTPTTDPPQNHSDNPPASPQTAPASPPAATSDDVGQKIDALPERIIDGLREVFTPPAASGTPAQPPASPPASPPANPPASPPASPPANPPANPPAQPEPAPTSAGPSGARQPGRFAKWWMGMSE